MTVAIIALLVGLVALYYWAESIIKELRSNLKLLEDNQFAIKDYVENLSDNVAKVSTGHNKLVVSVTAYIKDMQENDPYVDLMKMLAAELTEQGKRISSLEKGSPWNH